MILNCNQLPVGAIAIERHAALLFQGEDTASKSLVSPKTFSAAGSALADCIATEL
jgi:hypothetical protein